MKLVPTAGYDVTLAKHKFFTLLVALLLFTFLKLVTQAQGDEGRELRERGTITGRVVNDQGQPLSNVPVLVRLANAPAPVGSAVTDNEGKFRVDDLVQGVYSVHALAPSYFTPARAPEESLSQVRIGDEVTLTLIKGGVITGRITNATGQPVVQVPIRAILVRLANGQAPVQPFQTSERMSDDRGIYRLYGLPPGTYIVSAGSRGTFTNVISAYDSDAPTYAPSSTRDNAAEITIGAREELEGVDIAYSGEPGRSVSGTVVDLVKPTTLSISLTRIANELPQLHLSQFVQTANGEFTFSGLAEGEYEISVQTTVSGETAVSEPRRISVENADVTGIRLSLRLLGSIAGQVIFAPSSEPDCQGKRRPILSEMLISTQRIGNESAQWRRPYFAAQSNLDQDGKFHLRNLRPELYRLNTRFVAKYWYLKAISIAGPAKTGSTNKSIDAARNGITLKFGDRLAGVTISLAEGAASFRGRVSTESDEHPASDSSVILLPVEKDHQEDVLRYFSARLVEDGSFAIGNIPPGQYLALVREATDEARLREPDQSTMRTQLRVDATETKTLIEFKPCQNIVDYEMLLKSAPLAN